MPRYCAYYGVWGSFRSLVILRHANRRGAIDAAELSFGGGGYIQFPGYRLIFEAGHCRIVRRPAGIKRDYRLRSARRPRRQIRHWDEDVGRAAERFCRAWERAERGETFDPETHITRGKPLPDTAAQWLEDNRDAIAHWNGYFDDHGLPLARYRQF